jgi:hypothetical protein
MTSPSLSKSVTNPEFRIKKVLITSSRLRLPVTTIEKKKTSTNTVVTENDTGETDDSFSIDITAFVSELIIFESLDRPYMSGKMVVLDDSELFNGLELQGTENVQITLATEDSQQTDVILNKKFIMTGIESQTKSSEAGSSSVFTITLLDEIAMVGRATKIRKSYSGSLEKIIKSVVKNELGRDTEISYTGAKKPTDEFGAQENITCIVPNLNALETIDWISSRLTTKNGSPYFCFATLNIPHHKDGSFSVKGEEDIKAGNIIRLGNLDTMLEQEPFNKIPYRFTPQTNSTNANQSREKQVFNIRAIETPASSNTLKLIDIGAISSTYSNTNLGTGEVHKSEHSIVRTLSNISKDDIIEKEGKVQNVIDPTAKFKDKNILRYKSRNFHTITSSGTYGNLNSYHDERVESKFKTKIESKSIKAFLNKNPLTIVIEGSGFIVGRGGVGQIISIDIRGDNVRAEKREELSDSRYSGNHLIYDVKHHFARNLHNVTLNLRKLESKL